MSDEQDERRRKALLVWAQTTKFFLGALAERMGLRLETRDDGADVVAEIFSLDGFYPLGSLRIVGGADVLDLPQTPTAEVPHA